MKLTILSGPVAVSMLAAGLVVVPPSTASGAPASAQRLATASTSPVPGSYVPVPPRRILDTRIGLGARKAAVQVGSDVVLQVDGRGGLPAQGEEAVVLTVTATQATGSGDVAVTPGYDGPAKTSTLNFVPGRPASNVVMVRLGSNPGTIALSTAGRGTVELIADVSGYVQLASGGEQIAGGYRPEYPLRILDTRRGLGAPAARVAGGKTIRLQVNSGASHVGQPYEMRAVALNITATGGTASGYVTAYQYGTSLPGTSNINFLARETVANLAVVPMSPDGFVDLHVGGRGAVDLIADIAGYLYAGAPSARGMYHSVTPTRLLDTRKVSAHGLGGDELTTVPVTGRAGVPADVGAVVLTVTAVTPTSSGYLTAYPAGGPRPPTANVVFGAGGTTDGFAITSVDREGRVAVLAGLHGHVQLIVEITGYFLGHDLPAAMTWRDTGEPLPVNSVACVSTRFCLAVTRDGHSVTFDGARWSSPVAMGEQMMSVRCASTTFCVAGSTYGDAVTYNGVSWSTPVHVDTGGTGLTVESCPLASHCVAFDGAGEVFTLQGTSWSAPTRIDVPDILATLSCPSTTYCVAGDTRGRMMIFSGGRWSAPAATRLDFLDISCPAVKACVAIVGGLAYQLTTAVFDGSKWTGIPQVPSGNRLVSCPAAVDSCVAISTGDNVDASVYNGYGWSTPDKAATEDAASLSCAAITFCLLVTGTGAVRLGT